MEFAQAFDMLEELREIGANRSNLD